MALDKKLQRRAWKRVFEMGKTTRLERMIDKNNILSYNFPGIFRDKRCYEDLKKIPQKCDYRGISKPKKSDDTSSGGSTPAVAYSIYLL
jgi:hypothetical protein